MHPLSGESLLTPQDAAGLFPGAAGRDTSPRTVILWIRRGVTGPTSERVYLEGFRVGSRWMTSAEAVARFIARLSGEQRPQPCPQTDRQRAKRNERTRARLIEMGLMTAPEVK